MLPQRGDADRVNFENQGIPVFYNSSLYTNRLPHAIEKGHLRQRLLVRVCQLKHRGLAAEVVRGKQKGNASAETPRSAVAVHFAAARIHDIEVAFAVHDFTTELENSKCLGRCGQRLR